MDQMCLTSSSLLRTWMYVHTYRADVLSKLALCSLSTSSFHERFKAVNDLRTHNQGRGWKTGESREITGLNGTTGLTTLLRSMSIPHIPPGAPVNPIPLSRLRPLSMQCPLNMLAIFNNSCVILPCLLLKELFTILVMTFVCCWFKTLHCCF